MRVRSSFVLLVGIASCGSPVPEDPDAAWVPGAGSGEAGSSSADHSPQESSGAAEPAGSSTGVTPGSTGTSDSESGEPSACAWVRITGLGGESLNVRSAPSTGADVVGTLFEGQVVAKLGEVTGDVVSDPAAGDSDLWYEIETAAFSGVITSLYAACDEEPEVGAWVWPVPLNPSISQDYGNPIEYQTCGFHTGLDVGGAVGDPIVAASDGVVVHVGPMWYAGDGQGRGPYAIILQHGDGPLYSTYGHNDAALVEMGDVVAAGETIAEVGNEGYSFGAHLHFEILEGAPFSGDWQVPFVDACGAYRDPKSYVAP